MTAVALLLAGVAMGMQVSRWQGAEDTVALSAAKGELSRVRAALAASEERNWKYYRENQALDAELRESAGEADTVPGDQQGASTQAGVFADGVYLVGEDIPAGTYDGLVTGRTGYWARLRSTTGMVDAIIANDVPRGPFVLTVNPTDAAVELQGVRLTAR